MKMLTERQIVEEIGKLLPPVYGKNPSRNKVLWDIYHEAIIPRSIAIKFPTFRNQMLGISRMSYEIGVPISEWLIKKQAAVTTDKTNSNHEPDQNSHS